MVRRNILDDKNNSPIIRLCNSRGTYSKIANLLELSRYSVRNIVRKYKTTGKITNADRREEWTKLKWEGARNVLRTVDIAVETIMLDNW